MVFLHLRAGLSLYVILKWTSIIGPSKPTASFRGEQLEWVQTSWPAPISPKGKPPGSQVVGVKSGSAGYSNYVWVDHRW